MTYDTNSFCAFNKRNGDKNTITYPFANGERVIIQRTYSNNGTSVFSEIRIDENGEKTVSVLHRAEMNDELFDRTREMLVEMHHKDENKEINFLKHTLNIDDLTDDALTVQSVEDDYIEEETRIEEDSDPLARNLKNAINVIDSCLTPKQKRWFLLSQVQEFSDREIARLEGCAHTTISRGMKVIMKKIEKFFEKTKKYAPKRLQKCC